MLLLLLLLVGFLLMDFLHGYILLLLVLIGICIAILIGLFAGVGVCCGHDELVDFEGVRIFGGRGRDTEIIALGQLDLFTLLKNQTGMREKECENGVPYRS